MDNGWIAKQLIDFQRNSFDHCYQTASLLQEHIEKVTTTTVRQASWMPAEGQRMIDEWTGNCRKGRKAFKKAVDEQFDAISDVFVKKTPAKPAS